MQCNKEIRKIYFINLNIQIERVTFISTLILRTLKQPPVWPV